MPASPLAAIKFGSKPKEKVYLEHNAGEPIFTFVVTLAAIKFGNKTEEQIASNS